MFGYYKSGLKNDESEDANNQSIKMKVSWEPSHILVSNTFRMIKN